MDYWVTIEGDLRLRISELPGNIRENVIYPELIWLYHIGGNRVLITRQCEGGWLLGRCRYRVNHHEADDTLGHNDLGARHGPT